MQSATAAIVAKPDLARRFPSPSPIRRSSDLIGDGLQRLWQNPPLGPIALTQRVSPPVRADRSERVMPDRRISREQSVPVFWRRAQCISDDIVPGGNTAAPRSERLPITAEMATHTFATQLQLSTQHGSVMVQTMHPTGA
jgi:hypothetical protein